MGKKQTDALITERDREIDALARRTAELEGIIKEYKDREVSIVEAITSAIDTKTSMIKDAEAQAKKITDEAVTKAEHIRAETKLLATRAKEEVGSMIEKARLEADEIIEKAQREGNRRTDAAKAKAADYEEKALCVIETLEKVSVKLTGFIACARASFDGAIERQEAEEQESAPQDNGSPQPITELNLPEAYDTPSDLFHGIMAIQGRNTPEEECECGCDCECDCCEEPQDGDVDVTPLSEKLLTTDEVTSGIKNIETVNENASENKELENIVREVIQD